VTGDGFCYPAAAGGASRPVVSSLTHSVRISLIMLASTQVAA
jgi:hypothetical protein